MVPEHNCFALAHHSLEDQIELWPSATKLDQQIESFEGSSDVQLQTYHERNRNSDSFIRNQMTPIMFAVLDERSTQDHTIIIHYFHRENGMEGPDDGKEIDSFWTSWRVRVAEAQNMMTDLEFTLQIYDEVYSKKDRYTGEDGVFPVEIAVNEWMGASKDETDNTSRTSTQ